MRVIAGTARRIILQTLDGKETRPTTDRIKETLFNMISNDIYDSSFLDLYSGSGAIGIEALSRGAQKATFVENNRQALDCIKKNLKATHLEDNAILIPSQVMVALRSLEIKNQSYDFIFIDPPYDKEYEMEVLNYLSTSKLIHNETVIIVEASMNTNFDYIENTKLQIKKIKAYKTNKHVFICKK